MKKLTAKKCALILCFIFAFCCVIFTFLPHLHECTGVECSTCALIKAVCDILLTLSFGKAISLSVFDSVSSLEYFAFLHSVREETLVGRKVKLSD